MIRSTHPSSQATARRPSASQVSDEAELVLSQILLTCRGYFRGVRQYTATKDPARAKDFLRVGAEWVGGALAVRLHEPQRGGTATAQGNALGYRPKNEKP